MIARAAEWNTSIFRKEGENDVKSLRSKMQLLPLRKVKIN